MKILISIIIVCLVTVSAFAEVNLSGQAYINYLQNQADTNDNATAMFELAKIYHKGAHGQTKNIYKKFDWLLKAGDQGFEKAYPSLIKSYSKGIGVKKNNKKAGYWLEKAKTSKLLMQDSNLVELVARVHLQGIWGYKIDKLRGRMYLEKAYEMGNKDVITLLASLTFLGSDYFKPDYDKALKIALEEPKKLDPGLNFLLGSIYFFGTQTIKPDYKKAYFHLMLANSFNLEKHVKVMGMTEFHTMRGKIEKTLDKDTIEEIKTKAKEYLKTYNNKAE